MNFKFKKEKTFEERRKEYEKIIKERPKKIPIICEKAPNCNIKEIDKPKTKYLVDGNLSLPQFMETIRKKLDITETEAIFLLANGKSALSQNETIATIYKKYKDKDGFLYFAYANEEIWG